MSDVEKTSLQRLLVLDKTFSTLDDRIEAAAAILGLSLDERDQVTVPTGNYGRYDFVYRWILDKLSKDATARANPLSWSLLLRLLTASPTQRVKKLLANSGLSGVVVETLKDLFHDLEAPVASENETKPKATKSKKRKRDEPSGATTDAGSQRAPVFAGISRILHSIAVPFTPEQVVDVVKFWLYALHQELAEIKTGEKPDNEAPIASEVDFITTLLATHTRSIPKAEAQAASAKELAWPSLVLAAKLHTLGLTTPEQALRKLSRQDLLSVSHDFFLRSTLSGASKQITQEDVATRFAPLVSSMTQYLNEAGVAMQANCDRICTLLASLFDDCYSLQAHHTPREKKAHGKWIESVFLLFYQSIDRIGETSDPKTFELRKHLSTSMLDHVQGEGDGLSEFTLEKVALEYSGLMTTPSISTAGKVQPDFALIARIIRIGPSIFRADQSHDVLSLRCLLDNINLHSSRVDTILEEEDVETWLQKVALPLVNAQIRLRRGEQFFEALIASLAAYEVEGAGMWYLWQHPDVRDALSQLMESSLDVRTIRRILQELRDLLKTNLINTKSKSDQGDNPIGTSLLRLAILVDVIRSDEMVDELRPDIQSLQKELIASWSTLTYDTPRSLIRLLLIQHNQKVVPDFDSSDDSTSFARALQAQSPCFIDAVTSLVVLDKLAKSKERPSAETMTSLAYALQMLEYYKGMQIEAPTDNAASLVEEGYSLATRAMQRAYENSNPAKNGHQEPHIPIEIVDDDSSANDSACDLAATATRVPVLLNILNDCILETVFNAAVQSLKALVKDKTKSQEGAVLNQYTIECLLSTLHKICSPSSSMRDTSHGGFLYNDVCQILRSTLQFHRPSLGGRLHIVIPLLKQLMACFFTPSKVMGRNKGQARRTFQHPPWLHQESKPLLAKHAPPFVRLITLLCNPPQSTLPGYRAGSDQPRLTDAVREARLHVSEFVPTLVHAYVHFQLHGVLGAGVKDALTPAIYAMFDVMDMAAPEDARIIALGASMGKAELALLRKDHGEWKRFGRWRGG